jgi:formate dehydrogenase maturation protein FdhE
MNKKTFKKILYSFKKSDLDIDRGWEVYLRILKLFKENKCEETYEYLEQVGSMDQKEKLQWRTKLAEMGIELTPSQVEDYIFILSLAIYDYWDSK